MARRKEFIPKAGKCDIIHGIIVGGEEIKNLQSKNGEDKTPRKIIKKLEQTAKNTSILEVKELAEKATNLLLLHPNQETTMSLYDREKIYKQLCQ